MEARLASFLLLLAPDVNFVSEPSRFADVKVTTLCLTGVKSPNMEILTKKP
jgi:hypothetical protein